MSDGIGWMVKIELKGKKWMVCFVDDGKEMY